MKAAWFWRRGDPDERRLVDECEQVLSGRYVEHVAPADAAVAGWAWLNLLAHGTADDLRAAARGDAGMDGWRQARSVVADRILEVVDEGVLTLADVQRSVLIPMEVDAMVGDGGALQEPGPFTAGILAALAARRHDVGGSR